MNGGEEPSSLAGAGPGGSSGDCDPILEGLVTTLGEAGEVNLSPMGPRVHPEMERFELRPFATSRTCRNLRRRGEGVLHVVDDVELLARAAVGRAELGPVILPERIEVPALADACRWYAFRVERWDAPDSPRPTLDCRVVERRRQRDFFGFNRAKHACVEAAILATRLEFLPRPTILDELRRLALLVEKTGGAQERRAFAFLQAHIHAAPEAT